ncbi:FAD-dependent oxidoreductase [Adlercreutzia sp. ZJ141]|uniref:FAD-dependent oxidoreductase n=1 Tax=Adlercreutzia sp. ZJ141 TaxID=2709406 RepID=UPI0013EC55BD|nr:FAD-dependent oxidoreductase [Adlercreutzia sp. ZJ141]
MTLSRRDFLKVGGVTCIVAGAGTALAGCSPKSDGSEKATQTGEGSEAALVGYQPVNFTDETDILIIGTGYAGLAAAMAPALAGKKIIMTEKQVQIGGDSATSCCFMFASGTELQLNAGNPTTIDQYWEANAERLTAGHDQYEWFPEWVKGKTYANTKFVDVAINDFGAKFQEPCTEEELPRMSKSVILPADGIGSGGPNILQPIASKLTELGVDVRCGLRATALIVDAENVVIGCRFEDATSGKITDIKAQSTVLATGGFADNGEMVREYLPEWANHGQLVHGCMGEGHRIAEKVGAKLSGMDSSLTRCNLMGDIPNCTTWGYWTPIVLVLPNGKRFIEEAQSHDAAQAALNAGYREWWSIFDQRAFDARAIGHSVEGNIKSHEDVYVKADTLEELAVGMDVPVDALVATFARYDELVASGEDTDFGKKAWVESLQPPYHALKLNVCRYKTSGGLVVGPNNQVLDSSDNEIPGLYAAGALTLESFASVSSCMATGYYVGETLAAL